MNQLLTPNQDPPTEKIEMKIQMSRRKNQP